MCIRDSSRPPADLSGKRVASWMGNARRARLIANILARMLRGCRACHAWRATFPFSLPRAYMICRSAVCCGVVLPVCPCVVSFSKVYTEHDTHVLWRTSRYPRSILVRHVRHARFSRDMLATSSQRCDEDATRKLLP